MTKTVYGKPNSFCWVEVFTPNEENSKKFYHNLLGWNYQEFPMPHNGSHYTFGMLATGAAAGLCPINEPMKQAGMVPHWASHVMVEDIHQTAEKAVSLGGKLIMPVMPVENFGHMAIIQDPTDAFLSLWQTNEPNPAPERMTHGMLGWNELLSTDAKKAKSFYTELFGWSARETSMEGFEYVSFLLGDKVVAGMMQISPHMGPMPSNWAVYFTVDHIETSAEVAKQNGAKELYPIQTVDTVGRFCGFMDPEGAVFALIEWQK